MRGDGGLQKKDRLGLISVRDWEWRAENIGGITWVDRHVKLEVQDFTSKAALHGDQIVKIWKSVEKGKKLGLISMPACVSKKENKH